MFDIITKKPSDFIHLEDECQTLKYDLSYLGENNFTGGAVPGYKRNTILCTKNSGIALLKAQNEFLKHNLSLFIFDSYRPHKSVIFFKDIWALKPDIVSLKNLYYPTKSKSDLFNEGFLAEYSSHSRGSTFDLSLYCLKNDHLVEMGTCFDYFHEKSFTNDKSISSTAIENRMFLNRIMTKFGFINYEKEWWHFRYEKENYNSDTLFDFDIN